MSSEDTTLLKRRIRQLSNGDKNNVNGKAVLYVASRDLRVHDNHALLAAQQHAIAQKLPLIVAFIAYDFRVGRRSREHMSFLLDGLEEFSTKLKEHNISYIFEIGSPRKCVESLIIEAKPSAVYFDFNPLRGPRALAAQIANLATRPVYQVDTHNLVPVWVTSEKLEYAARTIRSKIHHHMTQFLVEPAKLQKHPHSSDTQSRIFSENEVKKLLNKYPKNNTDISRFVAGEDAAHEALNTFVSERLSGYATNRNDPSKDHLSSMSPYLHYGFISSLRVALTVCAAASNDSSLQVDVDTLIEEMIVRKELSDNWCFYNKDYDSLIGAPEWAQRTLNKHVSDDREFLYTLEQFEKAETHDEAWNAAQRELTRTGKMHGYMRMYWAKKILEWSESPEEALKILLYLNDFYHLDGGDPNGYVGILWSIAGVHDRPWGERAVYGTIRSMVYSGLKRKFDIKKYIEANNYEKS